MKTLAIQLLAMTLVITLNVYGAISDVWYGFAIGVVLGWNVHWSTKALAEIRALRAVEKELTRAKTQAQKRETK